MTLAYPTILCVFILVVIFLLWQLKWAEDDAGGGGRSNINVAKGHLVADIVTRINIGKNIFY